jgi:hypothetical protein
MKTYRIQNDIVAAHDEQEAIATWAEHYAVEPGTAGPVEEVDPHGFPISIEEEDGSYRDGTLIEVLDLGGKPCVIAFGSCADCP